MLISYAGFPSYRRASGGDKSKKEDFLASWIQLVGENKVLHSANYTTNTT
jgi:hypothetical protein